MKDNKYQLARALRKNQTPWEIKLWKYLRAHRFLGLQFKRQLPIDQFIVDFCCPSKKIIVELDGSQHNIENSKRKDLERTHHLESKGYTMLRFWNNDIDNQIDSVLETIKRSIN